jgi:hypothetical protein
MLDFAVEIDSEPPNSGKSIKPDRGSRSAIRKAISLIIIGVCVLGLGCQEHQTIWSAEARSPDGYWLASGRTEQHAGPGNAGVYTSVYLKRTNDSKSPEEVLGFSFDSAYPSGTSNVKMNWVTPSHLDVTYNGHADLYFQVVKYAGIVISVRDLSGATPNTSQ